MDLTSYRTLGRSGLVVSPLALGTMTFGTSQWGANERAARAIYDRYTGAGGNFVDTADVYAGGKSEEMLGRFVASASDRDRIVIATKSGFPFEHGHPHVGGNGAKHIHAALEGSLRRLSTDHVDLYWIHIWDQVTPAEEVLATIAALIQVGKIRYWGLSNVPSWYVAKIATLAAAHGMPGPVALQFEYSLIERGVDYEHAAVAREYNLGVVPWSPLGGGFLTGKYNRDEVGAAGSRGPELPSGSGATSETGEGRLAGANPFGDSKFTERNWSILDALRKVGDEIGAPLAQVALAWLAAQPCVAAILIGASRVDQIEDNIASLRLALTVDQRARLDDASKPDPISPFSLSAPAIRRLVFGGFDVTAR